MTTSVTTIIVSMVTVTTLFPRPLNTLPVDRSTTPPLMEVVPVVPPPPVTRRTNSLDRKTNKVSFV